LYKDRPGYDVIVQGEAGIQDITGNPDGPPFKVGTSIADLTSGMNGAMGILAALYAAKTTGRGQHVSISMYESIAALLSFNAGIYFATGESPQRRGNAHATIVPYETFEASARQPTASAIAISWSPSSRTSSSSGAATTGCR
jgi:formyl-CoA transferase